MNLCEKTDFPLRCADGAMVDAALRRGTGRGVKVAVIDSGVETSHPGLQGLALTDDWIVDLEGGRLTLNPGKGEDVYGHGTAVAGILRRIAPECRVGSFRVISPGMPGTQATVIREAVRLALDLDYDILNCSFGCIARRELLPGFKQWIDEACLRGRHIVAASSNEDAGIVEWPAHFVSVISVSHTEIASDEWDLFQRDGQMVRFGAKGLEAEALWLQGRTRQVMGSSFASPRVAGLLARLLSVHPGTPPLIAKEALAAWARPWPRETPTVVIPT